METLTDPLNSIRDEIERVAHDAPNDPTQAVIALARTRDQLVELLGRCDTYSQSAAKLQESEAAVSASDVDRVYQVADVREDLIEAGALTVEECEEAGVPTRGELDELREEGLLLDAVTSMKERWGQLDESIFNPYLHPRDRVGRFRHNASPQLDKLDDERDLPPDLGTLLDMLMPKTPDESKVPDPKLSPEVQRIASRPDAEKYFGTLGLTAKLDGIDDVVTLRQLAQAVTDAKRDFPSLSGGRQGRLAGVRTWQATHLDMSKSHMDELTKMFESGNVWAVTGPDLERSNGSSGAYDVDKSLAPTFEGEGGGGKDTWITLAGPLYGPKDETGKAVEFFDEQHSTMTKSGGGSVADRNPYGRLMHELGHAVAQTSGVEFQDSGGLFDVLEKAKVGPGVLMPLSRYGASNASEGWAEIFSTLNVPGAFELYDGDTKAALRRTREIANRDGRKVL